MSKIHQHVIRLPWSAVRSVTPHSWRQAVFDEHLPVPSSTAFINAHAIVQYVKEEVDMSVVVRSDTVETSNGQELRSIKTSGLISLHPRSYGGSLSWKHHQLAPYQLTFFSH